MNETCDIVVVGFGMAGLAAAITAHDAGAEVLVLEKMPASKAGGNSRVSGQVWFCPTDVELAKAHLGELADEYPVPEDVASAWAEETSHHNDWVRARAEEVNGQIPRDDGDPYTGDHTNIVRRSFGEEGRQFGWEIPEHEYFELKYNECGTEYNYIGGSQGWSRLWLTLKTAFERREIPVLFETRATELIQGEDGEIVGLRAERPGDKVTILARQAVILASGGFANNSEMARNYLRLSYVTPWGSPGNTGDGIRIAQAVGADLAHPYNYMAMPGIQMPPYEAGEFAQPQDGRYIHVGADGRRFVNEAHDPGRHGKIPTRGMFDFFPGHPMWTIFDEDARLAGPIVWPRESYAACWMKQVERYEWSEDNSAEIERGWVTRGATIRELAEKLEIDPDGLEAEVERYNAFVEQGEDSDFGHPVAQLQPIRRGPFYGYRWAQLLITTLGGIRKDGHGRAQNPDGEPIPRLYCAGDVASTYTWMLSGGMGLGDAMAFGRRAAAHAAAHAPHASQPAASGVA